MPPTSNKGSYHLDKTLFFCGGQCGARIAGASVTTDVITYHQHYRT